MDRSKGKQGYKCDVSLKGGIQIICTLENDATLYIADVFTGRFRWILNNLRMSRSVNRNLIKESCAPGEASKFDFQ